MMKSLYYATSESEAILFSRLLHKINDLIVEIYNTSPFFATVWPYLPHPSTSPLLSAENLKFAILLLILAWGVLIRDSGRHLSQRIVAARQRAEAEGWERSMTGDLPRPDVLTVQIDLTAKDQWYKRPLGIVLLAIISGGILLLIGRFFNLSG